MNYTQIAAVDLGSNSFRLEIGRVLEGQIYPLDSFKDVVRLASGLDDKGNLTEEAQERALATLARYGERLRELHPEAVRAVATNTFRVAKNAKTFLPKAEEALGFPIEIIGGREEARLIYIGAVHSLPPSDNKRLLVDIGGGSTEFIIGEKHESLLKESLYMGCVSYSKRFFPEGKVSQKRFNEASISAKAQIEAILSDYLQCGFVEAVGSSGTAHALTDLFGANHLNADGFVGITREALFLLRDKLIAAGTAAKLKLNGISEERIPVLAGGLAIMCAVFESFAIDKMAYSEGALRLGVLYDLLGRVDHKDMRDTTIEQFRLRYQADPRQVARVLRTATFFLSQLADLSAPQNEVDAQFLRWAVALHEIGISVAQSGFHKHGAYVVANADMPGFSKKDQEKLALLILGQRNKLERVKNENPNEATWRLIFCLRLATLLHRKRSDQALPALFAKEIKNGFSLEVPNNWLAENALSEAALHDEINAWKNVGFSLQLKRKKEE